MARNSKIDKYAHLLGTMPDSAVAKRAKVTSEAVRIYRVKRNIPSFTDKLQGNEPVKASNPEPAQDPAENPFRKGGKPSPIDAVAHLLGTMPDKDVAAQAGASTAAVYQYRRRRKIPAFVPHAENAKTRPSLALVAKSGSTIAKSDAKKPEPVTPRLFSVTLGEFEGDHEHIAVIAVDFAEAFHKASKVSTREVIEISKMTAPVVL